MSILNKIIEDKKLDLKNKGYTYGIKIPDKRRVPIVPLTRSPIIICEIKRSSPSKGIIKADIDPVKQTAEYVKRGVKSVSVLTEERYFSGSLRDLILVKEAFPDISILRKDFIISEEEVDISYRAGADAVLLIASIHTNEELYRLYRRAKRYRMDVLFEIHSEKDIEKANRIKPDIVGINSRKLDDFTIDLFHPLKIKRLITWKHTSIFESGIKNRENAVFALSSGFDGMLIGEAVVKNPDLIKELKEINKKGISNFWEKLFRNEKSPLVKICGITTVKDADYLVKKGVNALGFVFAPSPRLTNSTLLEQLKKMDIPKVGVITPESLKNRDLKKETEKIIKEKLIDALQLHGFSPSFSLSTDTIIPYYNAVRVKGLNDLKVLNMYNSQRILIDSFDPQKKGGTGKSISDEIINEASKIMPLWIAGGIGANNVKSIIKKFKPELIDASSSLEISAGIKDHNIIDKYFQEIENAGIVHKKI